MQPKQTNTLACQALTFLLPVLGVALFTTGEVQARTVNLDGAGWSFHTAREADAHPVTVPDCWPNHPEYLDYVGSAVYERDFDSPLQQPGDTVRLHFDAVYASAHVWLNGARIGDHQGGYTPFDFDITRNLRRGTNHLTIEVDNSYSLTTIPGLATAGHGSGPTEDAHHANVFGWWTYGGIPRPVALIVTDPVYLQNIKIESKVDVEHQSAQILVKAWMHNSGTASQTVPVHAEAGDEKLNPVKATIAPGHTKLVSWSIHVSHAHLWNLNDPFLYPLKIMIPGDELTTSYGLRDVRVRGVQLLLNGIPIHAFGANRVSEGPQYGLEEPDSVIERDLGDMLADNMRMMRIAHYPLSPRLLDFADRHGMLLIEEAGNWNMGAWQMDDKEVRSRWKSQMHEMVERDWNHPSIIAWSVGNEYESDTPAGIAWTRDMRAFTLGLDATRLITFASRFTFQPSVTAGTQEASQYSDFVCINMYDHYPEHLDKVHALWPDKPVFVTEFGKMGEEGLHDTERIANITQAVNAMKSRPWVIGGSLWTWADYRSRFPGTPADGIRKWGVVTFDRHHRDSWQAVHDLFATDFVTGKH